MGISLWLVVTLLVTQALGNAQFSSKLSDSLQSQAKDSDAKFDVVVELQDILPVLKEHPSLNSETMTRDERRATIINILRDATRTEQEPVLRLLNDLNVNSTSFWVANQVIVEGISWDGIEALLELPEVVLVREPATFHIFPVVAENITEFEVGTSATNQYGVEKINAPKVWAKGHKGKGVVVGIIDTGLNAAHVALRDRIKKGAHTWHDAFKQHKTFYDGNGHGSHCAGTVGGDKNGIGVAPEAKLIACRALGDKGQGSERTLMECAQFMACPSGGQCSGLPDVVSNSWGDDRGGNTRFNTVIKTWKKLDIFPVFAIGNKGASAACGNAGSPGDQEGVLAVGATDQNDKLAKFSSKGPPKGNTKLVKPDVSAPGVDIMSASNKDNQGYAKMSGTSMAAPHVSGAVALLLSAKPKAKYQEIVDALESTAFRPPVNGNLCKNGGGGANYPNNLYGYGRIDVDAALKKLLKS